MNSTANAKRQKAFRERQKGKDTVLVREYVPKSTEGFLRAFAEKLRQGAITYSISVEKEAHKEKRETHGNSQTPEYKTWINLKDRCSNKKHKNYKDYGGRGISVCDRWNSFEDFMNDMGFRPSENHSLDRVDNDGNYEPNNCRWATSTEQNRNQRIRKNNTTGVRGVNLNGKKYVATIGFGGKLIYLGSFATLEDAREARTEAENKYWNE